MPKCLAWSIHYFRRYDKSKNERSLWNDPRTLVIVTLHERKFGFRHLRIDADSICSLGGEGKCEFLYLSEECWSTDSRDERVSRRVQRRLPAYFLTQYLNKESQRSILFPLPPQNIIQISLSLVESHYDVIWIHRKEFRQSGWRNQFCRGPAKLYILVPTPTVNMYTSLVNRQIQNTGQ